MDILINDVVDLYYEKENSLREIATIYSTYPNKIKRLLTKHGYELRDYSEAQKLALDSGKVEHPTAGKKLSDETKIKLSKAGIRRWEDMSDEDRESHSKKMKAKWDAMTPQEQEDFRQKSAQAIRQAADEGSDLEKYVYDYLTNAGVEAIFHWSELFENKKLEVDIFLPQYGIAIEIDGPSHFLPIWGEDRLQKTIKSDQIKNGIISRRGFKVIRVKCLLKTVALAKKNEAAKAVYDVLDELSKQKLNIVEIEIV